MEWKQACKKKVPIRWHHLIVNLEALQLGMNLKFSALGKHWKSIFLFAYHLVWWFPNFEYEDSSVASGGTLISSVYRHYLVQTHWVWGFCVLVLWPVHSEQWSEGQRVLPSYFLTISWHWISPKYVEKIHDLGRDSVGSKNYLDSIWEGNRGGVNYCV